MQARINIEELKPKLIDQLPALINAHLPSAKSVSGGWRIGDLNGNKGSSLFISDEGTYYDHADTSCKGNIFNLTAHFSGKGSFAENLRWCADQAGYVIPEAPERRVATPKTTVKETLTGVVTEKLSERGLSAEILQRLPIRSLENDTGVALLHNNEDGSQCQLVKYYDFATRGWSSNEKPSHILWPMDYVTSQWPEFTDYLVITEGHWDAIAYLQAGIPAVSIPSGVNNDKWIEECYDFLGSFEHLVLSYDSDEAGRDGAARVAARLAAILSPPKIAAIPKGCKDGNDILREEGTDGLIKSISEATTYAPPEIIAGSDLVTAAIAAAVDNPFQLNTPFANFPFHFRTHEMTLYTGYTGHGKSNLVEQFICHLISTYESRACIASFEDQPERIAGKLLIHQFGQAGLQDNPTVRDFMSFVEIYNTKAGDTRKNDPLKLIDLFVHLYNRWGTTHFVVDNLMTLAVGRDDYEKQVDIIEAFRAFINQYPVHLHLVAHPRKPPNNVKNPGAPDPYDVRGPGEIADLSFNVLSLVRHIEKERQVDLLIQSNAPAKSIQAYCADTPDSTLVVHKQRATGVLPSIRLWFNHARKIYTTQYEGLPN